MGTTHVEGVLLALQPQNGEGGAAAHLLAARGGVHDDGAVGVEHIAAAGDCGPRVPAVAGKASMLRVC